MSPSRLSLLLAAALAGCASPRDLTPRAQQVRVAAIPLPDLTGAALQPLVPGIRVAVGASGLDVDDVAYFAALPAADRERLLRDLPPDEAAELPFVHTDLVRLAAWSILPPDHLAPGQLEIRPLREALEYQATLERRLAVDGLEPRSGVNFYIDRDAPYGLVAKVVYTTGQAEYPGGSAVVRTPGGERVLPRYQPEGGRERACPWPGVLVYRGGVAVRTEDLRLTEIDLTGSDGAQLAALSALAGLPPPKRSSAPSWRRPAGMRARMVLRDDHACPSVPRREGQQDLASVTALLREVRMALPRCDTLHVAASSETPWGEVAAVGEAALEAGFRQLQLTAPNDGDPAGECAEGLTTAAMGSPGSGD